MYVCFVALNNVQQIMLNTVRSRKIPSFTNFVFPKRNFLGHSHLSYFFPEKILKNATSPFVFNGWNKPDSQGIKLSFRGQRVHQSMCAFLLFQVILHFNRLKFSDSAIFVTLEVFLKRQRN